MSSHDSSAGPSSKSRTGDTASRIVLALLAAATLTSLYWLVHPYYDFTIDGAIYLLTAKSILAGEGYSYLGEPFTLRPPGFPVLLIPPLAMFGTDFWVLNLWMGVFGALCVWLLFVYLRPRLGIAVALAIAVSVWLNPPFRRWSTQIMSDGPGAACFLLCLVVERWARRNPFPRRDLLLGVMLAGAAYVRSLNLLLVPAILLARWLNRSPAPEEKSSLGRWGVRRALLVVVVPFLLVLPWEVRNHVQASPSPAEQTRDYSYWVAMWHTDRADPQSPRIDVAELLARVPERLGEILPLLGSRLHSNERTPLNLILGVVGLACWALTLARRREAAEIFVGIALAVLSVYFAFVLRLMLPLYLVVLPAVADTALWVLRRVGRAGASQWVVTALLAGLVVVDFEPRADWPFAKLRHRLHARVSRDVAARIPPDMTLAAVDGAPLSVFLGRPVYNLRPSMARSGLPGALAVLRHRRIETVVVPVTEAELLAHLAERYEVVRRSGPLWILRIDDLSRLEDGPASGAKPGRSPSSEAHG